MGFCCAGGVADECALTGAHSFRRTSLTLVLTRSQPISAARQTAGVLPKRRKWRGRAAAAPQNLEFYRGIGPEGGPHPGAQRGRALQGVGFGFRVLIVIPAEQARAAAKRTTVNAHPDAPRLGEPPRCGLGGWILSVPRSHRRLPLCSTCCLPRPPTWGTCGGLIIV